MSRTGLDVTKDDETPLEGALSKLLLATVLMNDDLERGLTERGLTQTRAHALWAILHQEPVTQSKLAETLRVTPRNVTTLIDALEETGFVARKDHPTDRRATLIELTAKGRKAASRLKAEKREFADALFGEWGAADVAQFTRTLDRIITRLTQLGAKPPKE
jgi:DNA-binding MarR family transcriptional regulator